MPEGQPSPDQDSAPEATTLKVFISYSRADLDFVDELELALSDRGFEVLVDRDGIDGGERWQKRLSELILACDTVTFVLTENSAGSKICHWEVEEARRLGKRVLAVTLRDLPSDADIPAGLADINWIHCWRNPHVTGSCLTQGFIDLESALRGDGLWLRQLTRLQERAAQWIATGKGEDSPHLLLGSLLRDAVTWSRSVPAEGASTSPDVTDFVSASIAREKRLESKALAQAKAVRRTGLIGAAVAGVFLVASVVAGVWGARNLAEANRQAALTYQRQSDMIAIASEPVREAGNAADALLMALYADPAGSGLDPRAQTPEGLPVARASLAAAYFAYVQRDDATETGNTLFQPSLELTHDGSGPWEAGEFSPDGGHLIAASTVGRVAVVWDAVNGRLVGSFPHDRGVRDVAMSRDGTVLGTISPDTSLRLWDVVGEVASAPRLSLAAPGTDGSEGSIGFASVMLSPDGTRVVTAMNRRRVQLWATATGDLVWEEAGGLSAHFNDSGDRIVTGSRVLDARTGAVKLELDTPNFVLFSNFSRNGERIVTTYTRSSEAHVWEASSGELLGVISSHEEAVWSADFSPDGSLVATASGAISLARDREGADNTVSIWDASTGTEILSFRGHDRRINTVRFSPDGNSLLTTSYDGTVKLWPLPEFLALPAIEQVRSACAALVGGDDPTAFEPADVAPYPVLWAARDEGRLVSPCVTPGA